MGKERPRNSAGSELQGIDPSCSLQDSGSFLCLSRKCKKSDFWVFHLPAHRTADYVSSIHLAHYFTNCWNILLSCLLFVFLTFFLTQTQRRSIDSKLLKVSYALPKLADISSLPFANFLSVPQRLPLSRNMFYSSEETENSELELHLSEVNSTTARSREIMTVRHSATSPEWNLACVLPEGSRWAAVGWEAAGARMC